MSTVKQPPEHGDGKRRGGEHGEPEEADYGLVDTGVDEAVAGRTDDLVDGEPDTSPYDGTTVDHGDTPGQRGSGH